MTEPEQPTAPSPQTPPGSAAPPPTHPPYGYPPQYYPHPVPPPYNTYAILAAILALLVLPPLGIYFGYKAKQQIAQTGERGIELAEVGIIAGWILTGLFAVILVVWCGFFLTFFGTFIGALVGGAASGSAVQ
jgi:hypothetical protein